MEDAEIERFKKCEICETKLHGFSYDGPLYCSKCISEMEKLSMSPERYEKYRELKETLKK